MTYLQMWWQWFLAEFRLNQRAICGQSVGRGLFNDYHDYRDDAIGEPFHFVVMRCKHCGKSFMI